jgi:hypothetical protein
MNLLLSVFSMLVLLESLLLGSFMGAIGTPAFECAVSILLNGASTGLLYVSLIAFAKKHRSSL